MIVIQKQFSNNRGQRTFVEYIHLLRYNGFFYVRGLHSIIHLIHHHTATS